MERKLLGCGEAFGRALEKGQRRKKVKPGEISLRVNYYEKLKQYEEYLECAVLSRSFEKAVDIELREHGKHKKKRSQHLQKQDPKFLERMTREDSNLEPQR